MATRIWRVLCHPRRTNEKRQNAGFARIDAGSGTVVKGRRRTGETGSRLADVRDDVLLASGPKPLARQGNP